MLQRLIPVIALLAILPLIAPAKGQAPQPQKTKPQALISHISWEPSYEKNFGISQKDFHDMGLGSLTVEQFLNLYAWVNEQEDQAKKSVPTQTFLCGRPGQTDEDAKPEAYDKIRIFVQATGEASEIISGVRERFRGMNGVEVVYSSDEADVKVSLVTIKTQNEAGYPTGVAISAVVEQPCVWKFGTYKSFYDSEEDQLVQVGSKMSEVVDSLVSDIDTRDLEGHRQTNAFVKKTLQQQK